MAGTITTTSDKLATAIAEWQKVSHSSVSLAEPLPGTGNDSYLITLADQTRCVLRLNGDAKHLGVDRVREREILDLIKAQHLNARCLHWSADFCVFEYLDSSRPLSSRELAGLFSSLHQFTDPSWFPIQPRWTPFDTIRDYLEALPLARSVLQTLLDRLEPLDWSNRHYGLCHIDPNPGNILSTELGPRLIDWEYARFGPTEYDVAVLFRTCPDLDQTAFLAHYALPVDKDFLQEAVLTYDVIELLWFAITEPEDWTLERLEARALELGS